MTETSLSDGESPMGALQVEEEVTCSSNTTIAKMTQALPAARFCVTTNR